MPLKPSIETIDSISGDDPDSRTIFVSGLDWRVTEKELKDHFEVCGEIVRVTVLKDRYTQFSKGCAYIQVVLMKFFSNGQNDTFSGGQNDKKILSS